ncbi:hypothetical protein [Deinococcus depolymerans]|uniref:Uncharacterized protein n=1 Tax=Deinococcus depolymerans TaxID=392408 RepID=A0ABP3MSA3_9DEIO
MDQTTPTGTLVVTAARKVQLTTGQWRARVATSKLSRSRARTGREYTALHLSFEDDEGRTASLMVPDFTRNIPAAFGALGSPLNPSDTIVPEQLLGLRGREATVQVHVREGLNGEHYANVVAINGQMVGRF